MCIKNERISLVTSHTTSLVLAVVSVVSMNYPFRGRRNATTHSSTLVQAYASLSATTPGSAAIVTGLGFVDSFYMFTVISRLPTAPPSCPTTSALVHDFVDRYYNNVHDTMCAQRERAARLVSDRRAKLENAFRDLTAARTTAHCRNASFSAACEKAEQFCEDRAQTVVEMGSASSVLLRTTSFVITPSRKFRKHHFFTSSYWPSGTLCLVDFLLPFSF